MAVIRTQRLAIGKLAASKDSTNPRAGAYVFTAPQQCTTIVRWIDVWAQIAENIENNLENFWWAIGTPETDVVFFAGIINWNVGWQAYSGQAVMEPGNTLWLGHEAVSEVSYQVTGAIVPRL